MAYAMTGSKIRIHVDPDLRDFMPKYVQNRFADLNRLGDFLRSSDLKSIQAICHKIRGHATSYGMAPLGEICKQMEIAAQNGEKENVSTLLSQFKNYLDCVELP